MKSTLSLLTVVALMLLAGCADVKVRSANHREEAAPAPVADGRTVGQLQDDNRQLRAQVAKLEKDNQAWQKAVDGRQAELRQLKKDRDSVKHDRDEYRKAVEKD